MGVLGSLPDLRDSTQAASDTCVFNRRLMIQEHAGPDWPSRCSQGRGAHSSGLRVVKNVMERAAATISRKLGDVANPVFTTEQSFSDLSALDWSFVFSGSGIVATAAK